MDNDSSVLEGIKELKEENTKLKDKLEKQKLYINHIAYIDKQYDELEVENDTLKETLKVSEETSDILSDRVFELLEALDRIEKMEHGRYCNCMVDQWCSCNCHKEIAKQARTTKENTND